MKKGQKKPTWSEMYDKSVTAKRLYGRGYSMSQVAQLMGYKSKSSVHDLLRMDLAAIAKRGLRGTLSAKGIILEGGKNNEKNSKANS